MSANGDFSFAASQQSDGYLDDEIDELDHRACYVFTPNADPHGPRARPSKRRKVSKKIVADEETAPLEAPSCFQHLLLGTESSECAQLRYEAYKQLWARQETRINKVLSDVNATTLNGVASFIGDASPKKYGGKIPTGLIVAGPSIASHGMLFSQISRRIREESGAPIVTITSGQASNLKTILKNLIRSATNQLTEETEDELNQTNQRGPKLLNYDLQILADHVKVQGIEKVIIAFQDSEAFDGGLLADLVSLLRSWLDRIPFILLFGVATSVEIFHENLPRVAIRSMQGEKIDVLRAEESLELVFNAATNAESPIFLGPSLSGLLLERQRDHIQSVQAFTSALKWVMWHSDHAKTTNLTFVQYSFVEGLLNEGETATVRRLLEDNRVLYFSITEHLSVSRDKTCRILDAISLIEAMRSALPGKVNNLRSDIYVKAVSGQLHGSALLRELLLSLKKSPSDILSALLESAIRSLKETISLKQSLTKIHNDLIVLLSSSSNKDSPLRSSHDIRHETLRTTIVAQKVELSKQKQGLSAQDATYSSLITRLHDTLTAYFDTALLDPRTLFGYEILFYDLKSPHRDVFTPKPRFAIERALSAPHDYLACNCCASSVEGGGALSPSQPATAILYQLYLESGALINVTDLWSAFHAIVGGEEEGGHDERTAL
ncbi:MAG: hypothetical protein M1819_002820 [Sarea resinae]|nr:MAG: hypothetical protein M1819_002820 [Sarea resinae]